MVDICQIKRKAKMLPGECSILPTGSRMHRNGQVSGDGPPLRRFDCTV